MGQNIQYPPDILLNHPVMNPLFTIFFPLSFLICLAGCEVIPCLTKLIQQGLNLSGLTVIDIIIQYKQISCNQNSRDSDDDADFCGHNFKY